MEKLLRLIFTKKRIIGWTSAIGFIVGGVAMSMDTDEFRDAVCGAPVVKEDQASKNFVNEIEVEKAKTGE